MLVACSLDGFARGASQTDFGDDAGMCGQSAGLGGEHELAKGQGWEVNPPDIPDCAAIFRYELTWFCLHRRMTLS